MTRQPSGASRVTGVITLLAIIGSPGTTTITPQLTAASVRAPIGRRQRGLGRIGQALAG
jgi:hypothetical protein